MSSRTAMLQRIREALATDTRPGSAPPLPNRGNVGYQGGGLAKFLEMSKAMGCFPQVVRSSDEVCDRIREILDAKNARRILFGGGLQEFGLREKLVAQGKEVMLAAPSPPGTPGGEGWGEGGKGAARETHPEHGIPTPLTPNPSPPEYRVRGEQAATRELIFAADAGITNVAALLAETGSLVMSSSPEQPRSPSLLPPLHIAIAKEGQIVADLFDLFEAYSAEKLPASNVVLITGPSKTGDIELKLVTGVHGPGEVHVIVLAQISE